MPTIDDVTTAIKNADAAGDSASVRALAPVLKAMLHEQNVAATTAKMREDYAPTVGMSTTDRALAGAGKAFSDIGSGIKQIFTGNGNQQEIDETKQRDAALMNTRAGMLGNVGGNVAVALPTAFIPGAQGMTGAALTGAALGGIQPVASDESRLKNIAIGGAGGAGGVLAARAIGAGVGAVKSIVAPFTAGGRAQIAGRTLESFGVTPADVASLSGSPTITGAVPTLAEQIVRPEAAAGAARLQDSLRSLSPDVARKMAAAETANNAARVATLEGVAGTGGARDFANAMRSGTAEQLYGDAFKTPMNPALLSPAERGEITVLLKRPAIQDAMETAKEIAANKGLNIGDPSGSLEGLHLTKLAMDDAISSAGKPGSAIGTNAAKSIEMARDRLVTFMDRMSPAYADARANYAAMSRPVNQMDVAQAILQRGAPTTTDLAGNPMLSAAKLGNIMADEPRLIKAATGRDLGTGKLSDLMEPEQLAKISAVAKEVDRAAAVAKAGNGPGSGTAQRMASTNVLRQILGPTGLPQSWAESTLLGTIARPLQFGASIAEPKIQMTLADLILDPSKAAAALAAASPAERTALQKVLSNQQVQQAARVALPAAAVSANR
jgi:hypothetical protein